MKGFISINGVNFECDILKHELNSNFDYTKSFGTIPFEASITLQNLSEEMQRSLVPRSKCLHEIENLKSFIEYKAFFIVALYDNYRLNFCNCFLAGIDVHQRSLLFYASTVVLEDDSKLPKIFVKEKLLPKTKTISIRI